jgi:hypothetical protein
MTRNRILWSGEESDFSIKSNSLWPRKPSRCLRYNIDRVLTRSDVTFTVQSRFSADKDANRTLNCRVLVRQPDLWSRQQRHSRLFLFGRFAQPAFAAFRQLMLDRIVREAGRLAQTPDLTS